MEVDKKENKIIPAFKNSHDLQNQSWCLAEHLSSDCLPPPDPRTACAAFHLCAGPSRSREAQCAPAPCHTIPLLMAKAHWRPPAPTRGCHWLLQLFPSITSCSPGCTTLQPLLPAGLGVSGDCCPLLNPVCQDVS